MFLFRKKNSIKIEVCEWHDGYRAYAHDGTLGVHNCYGTTREAAKEIALYQLRKFQDEKRDGIQRSIDFDFTKK